MPTLRDAAAASQQVRATLHVVRRRLIAAHLLQALAIGGLSSLLVAMAVRTVVAPAPRAAAAAVAGLLACAVVMIGTRGRRTDAAAAVRLELGYPSLRNLAVTAVELLADRDRVRPYMWDRVMQAAAHALTGADPARAVPLGREAAIAMAIVGVATGAIAFDRLHVVSDAGVRPQAPLERGAIVPGELTIDVTPPAYSGRPVARLRNPASVDALAGSVALIRVEGDLRPSVRINETSLPPVAGVVQAALSDSGFIAIESAGQRRLLPLTVTPDAAPEVRVTAPGRDLRVPDAQRSVALQVAATDDIGLRALELRYTIVSGGGEQYSFAEGTLPAAVAKGSARAWTAEATLSLSALKLEPGDALIYRAVAADARPGSAGEAVSDTYFVEIAGPGDVPLEGIDMPPDRERYALSQAMIVLKIQRLIARQAGMARPEVAEAAAGIAAEQRAVRANFIFLLGGEVEDEVVEAEASHEIQEGRLANQARREIVTATVLMRKVEDALAAVSSRAALPPAQEAVKALQRAFGRNRYLLRALPSRVRLDPARRLSGDVADARDWTREPIPSSPDRASEAARRAVAEAAAIVSAPGAPDARARLDRLAEDVLAIAPGAADLQTAARRVLDARDRLTAGDIEQARAALQDAVAPLLPRAQHGRIDAPPAPRDASRLAGAAGMRR